MATDSLSYISCPPKVQMMPVLRRALAAALMSREQMCSNKKALLDLKIGTVHYFSTKSYIVSAGVETLLTVVVSFTKLVSYEENRFPEDS